MWNIWEMKHRITVVLYMVHVLFDRYANGYACIYTNTHAKCEAMKEYLRMVKIRNGILWNVNAIHCVLLSFMFNISVSLRSNSPPNEQWTMNNAIFSYIYVYLHTINNNTMWTTLIFFLGSIRTFRTIRSTTGNNTECCMLTFFIWFNDVHSAYQQMCIIYLIIIRWLMWSFVFLVCLFALFSDFRCEILLRKYFILFFFNFSISFWIYKFHSVFMCIYIVRAN